MMENLEWVVKWVVLPAVIFPSILALIGFLADGGFGE